MKNERKFYRKDCEVGQDPLHYTMCGLHDVYLLNGFMRKETEHGAGVTVSDIDGLHRAIGLSLVRDRKVLSPNELRFLRKEMNFTQAELGAKIGLSSQQVARWEKGKSEIPGPADFLVRVFYVMSILPVKKRATFLEHLFQQMDVLRNTDETSTTPLTFEETDDGWEKRAA